MVPYITLSEQVSPLSLSCHLHTKKERKKKAKPPTQIVELVYLSIEQTKILT